MRRGLGRSSVESLGDELDGVGGDHGGSNTPPENRAITEIRGCVAGREGQRREVCCRVQGQSASAGQRVALENPCSARPLHIGDI